MAEQNPLLAQFMGGRQTGQATPFQVSQGQGMAPGQVAAYLQGNALTVPNRIDGKANQMIDSDPAADLRARERFQENVDLQVYRDQQAMERQKMQLEGQQAIADSNNDLTREITKLKIGSAEGMQDKELASKAEMFESEIEWKKYALERGISQQEAERIWKSKENDKKIAADVASQERGFAHDKDIKQMGINAQFDLQERAIEGDIEKTKMVNESRERIAGWSNEIARAELEIKEMQVTGNLELDKEKLNLSRDQYKENQRQFDKKLEADIKMAEGSNKNALERVKLQVEAQKYNVDKSFEIKEIEMQNEKDKAQALAPMIKDMVDTTQKWQTKGRFEYLQKFEEDYIKANAWKYKLNITDSKGNIVPKMYAQAKTQFYMDEEAMGQMRTIRDATLAAQDRIYEERLSEAYKAANKYGVDIGVFMPQATQPQVLPPTQGNPLVPNQIPEGYEVVPGYE